MKQVKLLLLIIVCTNIFASCKKIVEEDYNFCNENCVSFRCKIIDRNTNAALSNIKIRIAERYKTNGFSLGSDNAIGYFLSNQDGEFTPKIPSTDFNKNDILIQIDNNSYYNTIKTLKNYPDTLLILNL